MSGGVVIQTEGLGKKYQLGSFGYGSLRHDLQAWWAKARGREDPNARIGEKGRLDLHGDFWALKDLSFEVAQGERVGILGRNGAGKSTLLKILSQITRPTEGAVRMRGKVSSLLEVGTGFHPELTGRENVFLNGAIMGMKRREIQTKFDEIAEFRGSGDLHRHASKAVLQRDVRQTGFFSSRPSGLRHSNRRRGSGGR